MKAATANGAEVRFKNNDDWLIHKDGTKFKLDVYGRLYCLSTVEDDNSDEVNGCYDIQTWPRFLVIVILMMFQN